MECDKALRRRSRPWEWRSLLLLAILGLWCTRGMPAATVATYQFGRYDILLQEGMPVTVGDIAGMVRRRSGLPNYPLTFGIAHQGLVLNLLGPANRPLPLVSAPGAWSAAGQKGMGQVILERAVRQDGVLMLHVRQAGSSRRTTLRLDLTNLEHTLEGPR